MEALVDPERVALARSGDAAAFEALVEARVGSMVRTAMAILGREDEARDAVQDTLVTAWRELASLRDPAAFDAWLTRILVNRCRRGLRTFGLTRMREIPADEVAEIDLPRTADVAGAVVDRGALERAFGRLSIDERTILVLHHLDGRPLASIAAVLKIPEGTAKSRLFKARRSLERAMAARGGTMTAPLPDDQVRAMLEERAARVSPDAEREAMTAFRAAVRGAPDGKGGFAVIPQALSSRNARLPWGLAAVGMVAVVAIAVLGGRLSSTNDVASSPSAVAGSSATTGPAASLAPSAAGSPTVLDPGQLEAALASGDLAGKIVVINGKLVSELCSGPASDCKTHLLELPQLQITASDEPFIQAAWDAAIGGPAGPMTFRVGGDGSLDFLGDLGSVPDAPMTVDQLNSMTAPAGRLVAVRGWRSDPTIPMPCPNPPECAFTVLWAGKPTVGRRRPVAFGHPDDGRSGAIRHRDGVGRHDSSWCGRSLAAGVWRASMRPSCRPRRPRRPAKTT